LRHFRLADRDLGTLAAGRPSAATLGELRKAQLSRHLLLLREILQAETPLWYAAAPSRQILADPATGLYAATAVATMRNGGRPPPRPALVSNAPMVNAACENLTLTVRLEDQDPLRDRLGLPPTGRLTPSEVARWQDLLSESWQLLVRRHRPTAEILADVLRVIIPVEPDPAADGVSATSAHAYGAVAMSAPTDPVSLAVGLIHETAHSLLNATTLLFDLVRPSRSVGYSPWRDDPRPASGVLHGAYAYLAVARFWRTEAMAGGGRRAQFEFARWRAAVAGAADSLLGDGPVLTAAGRRFVGALRDEVGPWLDDVVDDDVARLAADANLDHRVRWRLRNLRVPDEGVRALVDAWRGGRARPELPESEVIAGARRLETSGRLRLAHEWLRGGGRDPEAEDPLRPARKPLRGGGRDVEAGDRSGRDSREGDQRLTPGGGVRPGDVAWLGGENGTARDAYLQGLETPEGDLAGLALVSPEGVLRERPEVVRAMWREVARDGPGIERLLAWLS
jgi:hypothetical protein